MLYYVVLCYAISYYIILYYIMLYYIILHYSMGGPWSQRRDKTYCISNAVYYLSVGINSHLQASCDFLSKRWDNKSHSFCNLQAELAYFLGGSHECLLPVASQATFELAYYWDKAFMLFFTNNKPNLLVYEPHARRYLCNVGVLLKRSYVRTVAVDAMCMRKSFA